MLKGYTVDEATMVTTDLPPIPVTRTASFMPSVTIRLRELMQEKTIRDGRDPEINPITQEEIANAIGVAQGTMSSWARGTVLRIDRDTIAKLCQYFDCEIQDLLHLQKDE
jgi:DNA-binding Xre family transcriptional regulator